MRVLRVIGGLEARMGGPSESAVGSIVATAAAGVSNFVVFPGGGDESTEAVGRLERASVPFREFRHSGGGGARSRRWGISDALVRRLPRLARDHDIVHAHGAWTVTSLAALVAAKLAHRPYVLTPHETLTQVDLAKSPLLAQVVKRLLRRLYLALADAVVVSSELEFETSAVARRAAGKFAVVPHAVVRDPTATPVVEGARREGLTVGFLGRFDAKKNLSMLLDAVAAAPPSVRLRLAGDGDAPAPAELEERALVTGVADRVELLGWLSPDARRRFLASIDVLALPSEYECFGMAAAEALAAGVPVIVSPATGVADLVRRTGCGLVVDAEVEALVQALADLTADGAVAALAAHTAGARYELSYDAHAAALTAVYQRIAPGSASPAPDTTQAVAS